MQEDNDEYEIQIAPHDTLLGQLQRGRGAGFLWALRASPSVVHPLLVECITHDPRCDHDIEYRSDYYARLTLLTGMSLAPLRHYLETTQDSRIGYKTTLTTGTLGRLAELGHPDAVAILRAYVGYGAQWDYALRQLVDLPDSHATDGLDSVICERFKTGEELYSAASYGLFDVGGLNALWQKWRAENPCIARLLDEVEQIEQSYDRTYQQKPDYKSLPINELLDLSDPRNSRHIAKILLSKLRKTDKEKYAAAFQKDNPWAWWVAFQCLQAMKLVAPFYPYLLDKLIAYLEALVCETIWERQKRTMVERILTRLPSEMTLLVARRWYISKIWPLQITGESIFKEHATEEDIPAARSTIAEVLAETDPCNNIYRICSALDILSRFAGIGILPEVEQAFVQAAYSYQRIRAAKAMHINAPTFFSSTYAYECLWDCEEEIRHLGCESVALSVPGAVERLRALRDDIWEDDSVRQTAKARPDIV